MAGYIKSLGEVEADKVHISLGGKKRGNPVEEGDQGCRGRTSGPEGKLVREEVRQRRLKEEGIKVTTDHQLFKDSGEEW